MDRTLDSLDSRFKPVAFLLLGRLVEAGVPVLITNTRRTAQEQADAVKRGTSKVLHSLHQDGLAIDVCPYEIYNLHGADKLNWDINDPVWLKMGLIGERLGLRWGGRFHPLSSGGVGWDPGHFEYITPILPTATI